MWRESFTHAHVHMLRIGKMSPTSGTQTVIQHQTFQSIHDKWLRRDYRPCHHWHAHSYTHVPTQGLSRMQFFSFSLLSIVPPSLSVMCHAVHIKTTLSEHCRAQYLDAWQSALALFPSTEIQSASKQARKSFSLKNDNHGCAHTLDIQSSRFVLATGCTHTYNVWHAHLSFWPWASPQPWRTVHKVALDFVSLGVLTSATYGMQRLFFMTMGAFTPTMNRVGLLPFWLWLHSHPWCKAPKARTLWVRVCSHSWRTETLLFIFLSMSASTQFSIGSLMAQPIK